MKPKTKKLTPAQKDSLTLLNSLQSANFYDLLHVGANGSTTTKLVALKLVDLNISKENGKTWSITQAGRDALAAGRYVIDSSEPEADCGPSGMGGM